MQVYLCKKLSIVLVVLLTFTQINAQQTGQTVIGEKGIVKKVADLLPAVEIDYSDANFEGRSEKKSGRKPIKISTALKSATLPTNASAITQIQQQNTQVIQSNFLAIDLFESGSIPPDPMGDVSLTQIAIVSNGRLKVYNKPTNCGEGLSTSSNSGSTTLSGAVLNIDLDAFFATVRNGQETTDPHIQYDRLSDRWFLTCINLAEPVNRILLAVSNSGTITNQSSFTFYQFQHDVGTAAGQPDNGMFVDYPTLGVDNNAVYLAGLIFNGTSFYGTSIYVVNKASVLSGGALQMTAFRRTGTNIAGMYCAQGVYNDDPSATLGYYVGVDAGVFGRLQYIVVNNPGGTPTITNAVIGSIPDTDFPINQTAQGSTKPLDGGDDRLLNAQMVKNKITGNYSIYTAHNVGVNSSGSSSTADRNAIRWYDLGVSGSSLVANQAGTLFDNAVSSATGYWMGSIAGTGQGHAVVAGTQSGPIAPANVAIAGRYSTTSSGSLFPSVLATQYNFSYNQFTNDGDDNQRWGDYSQTVVDPADDMTVWTFQQYTNGTNRWGVRAVQLKAPAPATPTQLSGLACNDQQTSRVTLTGNTTNNTGFFDPGSGYNKRLAVTSTGGATIANFSLSSASQMSFDLNYATATPGSQQTLTITNPDCQTVSMVYIVPSGCNPVPVTWVSIGALYQGEHATVTWQVANEEKVREYELQQSVDGQRFTPVGKVAALNQPTATYSLIHNYPSASQYYKVKQIDLDGSFTYSAIAFINKDNTKTLQLQPNPAKTQVQVTVPEVGGILKMLAADGRLLQQTQATSLTVLVETGMLPRGIYIVEYSVKGKLWQEKLLLQ